MKTRKIFFIILSLIFLFVISKMVRNFTVEQDVQVLKTEHFEISYVDIYKSNAETLAEALELSYEKIRTSLNDPKHEVIKVFIYGSQEKFNQSTTLTGNTNGTSRGPNEFHLLWTNWFNSIFPNDPSKTAIHEFTHCVQLNIMIEKAKQEITAKDRNGFDKAFNKKFSQEYPRWLWESISIYKAGELNSLSVKYAKSKKLNLSDLNNSNQIYNIGYTIVEFIVSKWGNSVLPKLIESFGDIETVLSITNQEFEKDWKKFVEENY